jgi:dTDP-4-dehydrorhamnose reductase
MLDRMRRGDVLRIVDDQIGAPTWARTLAEVLWRVALFPETPSRRVLHWTDAGECSHHQWAVAIRDGALDRGLLEAPVPIHAIPSAEYGAAAIRPAFSTLDCSETVETVQISQRPWRETLGTMLDEMLAAARDGKA